MKLNIVIFVLSLVFSARAQTNEIIVPTVTVAGTSYTNATVRKLNPAEAVIWCGELNKKVFTSQLPADMQSLFGYDAAASRQFIETRSERDAAFRQRYAEAMAAAQKAERLAEIAAEQQLKNEQQKPAAPKTKGKAAKGGTSNIPSGAP